MPAKKVQWLITCEHGGNEIPADYAALFRGAEDVLASHRGWDPGALELAQKFASELGAPLVFATISRLLVELNRSPHHRSLFSRFTRSLPADERASLLARYYAPYRNQIERHITRLSRRGAVFHLSVHSFTPVLDGEVRRADVGLLYDPGRAPERDWCAGWRRLLRAARPDLCVRRNYPYLGTADGLVTSLRRKFAANRYAGVELEVNQKYPIAGGAAWSRLAEDLVESLAEFTRQYAADKRRAAR